MAIANNALIIGLTGSFGSGCTALYETLQGQEFDAISLSKIVHEKWQEKNPNEPPENATRPELQDIGNNLRREKGNNAFMAENAIKEISAGKGKRYRLVFDSIRHPDEISALRKISPNCFIIAIGSSLEERWKRLKDDYERKNLTFRDFEDDDERDAFEDIDYGQKVQLCVDSADISIRNEEYFPAKHKQKEELWKITNYYIGLVTGKDLMPPTPDESIMAIAYTQALSSHCYKRQVGAVIQDEKGTVLGVGCNRNPSPLGSCYDEWGECNRDTYKRDFFKGLGQTPCPKCNQAIAGNLTTDYKCKNCGFNLDKYYIKDRAISRCTALHAEEAAIINVGGRDLRGCTIYTTTFPCFSCAQKIVDTGIKRVVYCEAYPDPDSAKLFEEVNKKLRKKSGAPIIRVYNFEGVKARAYFRVFGSWRREMEKEIDAKRGLA